MREFSRRELLTWFALTPTLPRFLVKSAEATSLQAAAADQRRPRGHPHAGRQ